jgi:RNA polymerase sigma factor (sigma-70 family)
LLGDPTAADDAGQDAWLKAREVQREVASPRGWMRTVLANLMRNQRRAARRRQRREQVLLEANEAAPSPEELLERLEAHRTLATLLTGLPEPGRQTVLLHYFEGLTSAQIAAATGVPAGTVRWRMKQTLDDLRSRLELHYGERGKSWRLVLLPLADRALAPRPASAAPAAMAATPVAIRRSPGAIAGAWLGVGALLVVALLVWLRLGWWGSADGSPAAVVASPGAPAPAPGRLSPRQGPRAAGEATPPIFAAAAIARPCPKDVAVLQGRLAEARAALAFYLPPRAAWHEAGDTPNEVGTAVLRPIMHRWLDERGAPRERRDIRCRADACKIKVTEPWPPDWSWSRRSPGPKAAADLDAIARAVALEGPVRDDEDGKPVGETWVWLRLRKPDGSPSRAADLPMPAALLPSGGLAPRPDPAARTEECWAATAVLEGDLEALRLRAQKELLAAVLFEKEPASNPALAERMLQLVAKAHPSASTPDADRKTPLLVECRGLACKVEPPPGLQVRADTMKSLVQDRELRSQLRRVSVDSRDGIAFPLYFTVVPPPSESRSGPDVLRTFMNQLHAPDLLAQCEQRSPARGTLSIRFTLPAEGKVNEDGVPRRIAFRIGEPLAATAFGRCVAELIATRAASFEVPADVTAADDTRSVELPLRRLSPDEPYPLTRPGG